VRGERTKSPPDSSAVDEEEEEEEEDGEDDDDDDEEEEEEELDCNMDMPNMLDTVNRLESIIVSTEEDTGEEEEMRDVEDLDFGSPISNKAKCSMLFFLS